MTKLRKLDERGATAVEYGLTVTAIAAVMAIIIFAVGAYTGVLFGTTCTSLDESPSLTDAGDCP